WVFYAGGIGYVATPNIKVAETREYHVNSDSLYFWMGIDFEQHGTPVSYGSRIRIPDYEILSADGKEIRGAADLTMPGHFVLHDTDGKLPDLAMIVLKLTKGAQLKFKPKESL